MAMNSFGDGQYLHSNPGNDGAQYLNAKSGPGPSKKYLKAKGGGSIASTYMDTPTGNDAAQYLKAASAAASKYGESARKMRSNYGMSQLPTGEMV